MELELDGKSVVVTGAGRGIGLAIARGFADAGAHVVAGTRTISDELDELVSAGSATALSLDLTNPQAAEQLVEAAEGRIDILVNNCRGRPAAPGGVPGHYRRDVAADPRAESALGRPSDASRHSDHASH